jgi:hypothetical protein
MPPAALASPSASFTEDGSMDIVSFAGLRDLRTFFFFFGRLHGGARIRGWRGRKQEKQKREELNH